MAYYLTIKDKNDYKLLDITNTVEFQRLSRFKGNSYSLEEIDLFTSNFYNEIVLKRKLYEYGVISLDEITKDISIRRKSKNEYKKVMYGLVYHDMKAFLDCYYLRGRFLELQCDTVFLNKLLDHYRNNYKQENLAKIRAILGGYSGDDINIFEALSSFFNDEVFDEDYQTGEVKVKYKSLHDLAMFIYNYLDKKNKCKLEIEVLEVERMRMLKVLQDDLIPKDVYVKKRVKKKKEELDGQISFFD